MSKIIGISINSSKGDNPIAYLDNSYINAVISAGAVPILIPNIDTSMANNYIDLVDGLIISGGADISSFIFGEDPHLLNGDYSNNRDKMEKALYFSARKKNIPILGICRGHQIINAVSGGTIVQDLSLIETLNVVHNSKDKPYSLEHYASFVEGSIIHEIFGPGEHIINSHHHQCIGKIATDFIATGYSRDNIIESMESLDKMVLCVQFHPERMDDIVSCKKIFSWLINKCEG